VATVCLLSFRAHDLGRRIACKNWSARFCGGIVVHAIAGFAALASVIYIGKRRDIENKPNSIPLIALGTGLLWFGWYGFNAGSALDVNAITGLAFLNTDVAASFAAITWLAIEWSRAKKPKFVGLLTGAVAGLATITPLPGMFLFLQQSSLVLRQDLYVTLQLIFKIKEIGMMHSMYGGFMAWVVCLDYFARSLCFH